MIKLYGHERSGNTYKVRLLLSLLGLDHEFVFVDLIKGEHQSPEFLDLNPFGQVPVLTDGDRVYQDAQAILVYLGRQYGGEKWLPTDPDQMARVIRWLSTTAGEIRQGLENARLYHQFRIKNINIERATHRSEVILTLMDKHLNQQEWLALGRPTIAEAAAFPYIALAAEGQISLDPYPHILQWMQRIKMLPGFIGMVGVEALAGKTLDEGI